MIFKNVLGHFSQGWKVRNSIFSLSLSLRWDGGMGFPALAQNGCGSFLNRVDTPCILYEKRQARSQGNA